MDKIIKFCLNNRLIVYIIFIAIIGFGIYSIKEVPVDAIPDIGENQVIVFADWPGRSPKDVENQVTYPLSTSLQGVNGVKEIRGQSGFGFSMIYIIFEDNIDFYYARTRVLEKLNYASKDLPSGVIPTLGPDATGLGQIFWYTVEGDGYNLQQLRTIQDWYIRYALTSVQGVSEVASVGGFVKQYQIDIDPKKLFAYNIKHSQVIDAVKNSNIDVGGKVIEVNGLEFLIRGVGFIKSTDDIENIVIGSYNGTPIHIKEVASVNLGPEFRRGILNKGGKEAVGGVIIMRYKENPLKVIERVKQKIAEISKGLPNGIKIVPFYDRTGLINETLFTLKETVVVEIIITILVILTFALPFRLSLMISLTLPLAVLISFILMKLFKIDAHIMSLSGIIIAIGTIVDIGIVITENIHRNMHIKRGEEKPIEEQKQIVFEGALEVAKAVIGAIATTIVPFFAILVLEGQSAKLFHPVVYTKTFVLLGSLISAIIFLPPLYFEFLNFKAKNNFLTKIFKKFNEQKFYKKIRFFALLFVIAFLTERIIVLFKLTEGFPYKFLLEWGQSNIFMIVFSIIFLFGFYFVGKYSKNIINFIIPWGLKNKWILFIPLIIFLFGIYILFFRIQNEFKPALDEGSFLFMPVLLPSASITQVNEVLKIQNTLASKFPEVENAVGKLGRIESATDPADITMIETIINLKPKKYWRKGMTTEKLKDELNKALTIPGVSNIWTQPIQNRIDMLSTGIRTPIGIKVFGADLGQVEKLAIEIEEAVKKVPGYSSSYTERIIGKSYIEYIINREEIARFGLTIKDVQEVIETAIGGENLTMTYEGRERYPIRVRYSREYRDNIESLNNILIITPDGSKIPISRIAEIRFTMGPAMINSENGMLRGIVYLTITDGTGAVDFVKKAEKEINKTVKIPKGYYYQFAGDFKNQIKAFEKLRFILPLCLLAIFLIMYFSFKSVPQTLIVFTAIPISLSGGVILLWLLGFKMSIAVVVGFIALFGVAVDDGIILTTYINQLKETFPVHSVTDIHRIIVSASLQRIRPLLMTTSTTILALVPILWSEGRGAEIIRPMSIPSIGGMLMVIITIFIVPLLNSVVMEYKLKKELKNKESLEIISHNDSTVTGNFYNLD